MRKYEFYDSGTHRAIFPVLSKYDRDRTCANLIKLGIRIIDEIEMPVDLGVILLWVQLPSSLELDAGETSEPGWDGDFYDFVMKMITEFLDLLLEPAFENKA